MPRIVSPIAALLLACATAFAQGNAPSGKTTRTVDPSLPHDQHGGMTVAANPCTDANRAKEIFGKADPLATGILPVEVFLRNETDQPIRIDLNTIQLEVHFPDGRRQDVGWLTPENVAHAIAHPGGAPAPEARRFPIGIYIPQDKKVDKLVEILRPLALDADIVPPMATIHGFLFFNVSHHMSLANSSSLYLPDATFVPTNKPLIFFEVSFGGPPQP